MPALVEFEHVWVVPLIFVVWFICMAAGMAIDKAADQLG
jgi:hypothetical protein